MNKVILMGRLVADPEVRYSQGEQASAVARYRLAVDRRFARNGEQSTDFIGCVAFGKAAEFAEKYFRKGVKIAVVGRIQTGSYKKDGVTVYTTDVVVEEQEFAESKNSGNSSASQGSHTSNQGYSQGSMSSVPADLTGDGFMNIPDGIDEELPFC